MCATVHASFFSGKTQVNETSDASSFVQSSQVARGVRLENVGRAVVSDLSNSWLTYCRIPDWLIVTMCTLKYIAQCGCKWQLEPSSAVTRCVSVKFLIDFTLHQTFPSCLAALQWWCKVCLVICASDFWRFFVIRYDLTFITHLSCCVHICIWCICGGVWLLVFGMVIFWGLFSL